MTLFIHYQSDEAKEYTQFPVVLNYGLMYDTALERIRQHLPQDAKHYEPIEDFSYMWINPSILPSFDDDLKIVNDNDTYLNLETFSRLHDNEVYVKLIRLDALQIARHWNTTHNHTPNVFEILKQQNTGQGTVLVHQFPIDVAVYYHLSGSQHPAKMQLNRLEAIKGCNACLDAETIDWFLIWYCRQNKETMLHSGTKKWKKKDKPKNTDMQTTIVVSCYAGRHMCESVEDGERNLNGLNFTRIQRIIAPVNVGPTAADDEMSEKTQAARANHWILMLIEMQDPEYYMDGNTYIDGNTTRKAKSLSDRPIGTVTCIDPCRQENEVGSEARSLKRKLTRFCNQRFPNVKWEIKDADYGKQTRQKDSWNCGIFACVNASCIGKERPLRALTERDFRIVRTCLANIMYKSGQDHLSELKNKAAEEANHRASAGTAHNAIKAGGDGSGGGQGFSVFGHEGHSAQKQAAEEANHRASGGTRDQDAVQARAGNFLPIPITHNSQTINQEKPTPQQAAEVYLRERARARARAPRATENIQEVVTEATTKVVSASAAEARLSLVQCQKRPHKRPPRTRCPGGR
jgi:hypothetical protein